MKNSQNMNQIFFLISAFLICSIWSYCVRSALTPCVFYLQCSGPACLPYLQCSFRACLSYLQCSARACLPYSQYCQLASVRLHMYQNAKQLFDNITNLPVDNFAKLSKLGKLVTWQSVLWQLCHLVKLLHGKGLLANCRNCGIFWKLFAIQKTWEFSCLLYLRKILISLFKLVFIFYFFSLRISSKLWELIPRLGLNILWTTSNNYLFCSEIEYLQIEIKITFQW